MPAFGEALSSGELQQIVDHLRTFCTSQAWPRGELNLPLALVTEKAFPENEAVLKTTVNTTGSGEMVNEFIYERRLGARSQFEVAMPVQMVERTDGEWHTGLGDIAVAIKHALFHSFDRGSILSIAGEVVLPTGKESIETLNSTTKFEPFVAFGQILPRDAFVQFQAGVEVPFDSDRAETEAFWRGAFGKTLTQGRFGRAWTPMVELLAARDLDDDATTHWDLVPQLQVTLSRRQHITVNAGVRFPINDRDGRPTQVLTYFLWDWFDGGLADGWR
jgi:hypothetical protein